MSDTEAPQSALDLGNLFGLNGIGDIGTAFGLFNRALNGEEITAQDIPESMNSQILQMAMRTVGASTVDEFLANPQIVQQIVAGLRDNTLDPNIANEDKIIVQHVANLPEEELREILRSNPNLLEIIAADIDVEAFRPMVEAEVTTRLANLTVGAALEQQGLTAEDTSNFPTDFLEINFSELQASDILGTETTDGRDTILEGGFSNEQLANLVATLPADQFNELVLSKMNENLPEDQQLTAPADSSFSDRQALFNQGMDSLRANTLTENALSLTSWFAAAITSEEDVENAVFDGIRDSIPAALENFQGSLDQNAIVAQRLEEFDPSSIDFSTINLDEVIPEGQLRQMVDDNIDAIATALTSEDNWPVMEAMILADNGRMIRENRDRIIDHMIPEMTEQGLSSFNSLMDQLPAEFRQLIQGFLEMFGGILQQFGININQEGPAPSGQQQPTQETPPVEPLPAPGE